MKKILYTALLSLAVVALHAQNPERPRINFSVQVFNKVDINQSYDNHLVWIAIYLKNSVGDTVYTNEYDAKTDSESIVDLVITLPPEDSLKALDISMLCYTVYDDEGNGQQLIEGGQPIGSYPKAQHASRAGQTQSFAGNQFDQEPASIEELTNPTPPAATTLLAQSHDPQTGKNIIRPISKESIYQRGETVSAVTEEPVEIACLATGEEGPMVFSDAIQEIEYFITVCADELVDLIAMAAFVVGGEKDPENRTADHLNAAVYAENVNSEFGIGVDAVGALRGSTNQGTTGLIAACTGTGTGAGVWGIVEADPPTGGFGYAVTADAQNRPASWAAAFLGNGFHTGTWTMSSDARLKTAIRSDEKMLEKVMQLRPSLYRYRPDTPYRLPDGEHYGFLAQEVEQIFPELVTEIRLPGNMDIDSMAESGSVDYKGINYYEMVSILTASLQELNTKVLLLIELQSQTPD